MAIKRIRKNISLREETINLAQQKADEMFNGNFSMYLTYLINKDCKLKEEPKETVKEEPKKVEKMDDDLKNALDNILGI